MTIAQRVISLIDLTSLGEHDDVADIDTLCHRAIEYKVAAVCVWPRFVQRSRERLAGTTIGVATVVNFPGGGDDLNAILQEASWALEAGAQEIDMVMPYRAWLSGDSSRALNSIKQVKQICTDQVLLKVILETGRLRSRERIAAASLDVINAGADFLKTSTGKIRISATPTAAEVILRTIRKARAPVGFKASGGIRSLRQAANYLKLADNIMGSGWVRPATFRFGASTLLDACADAMNKERR